MLGLIRWHRIDFHNRPRSQAPDPAGANPKQDCRQRQKGPRSLRSGRLSWNAAAAASTAVSIEESAATHISGAAMRRRIIAPTSETIASARTTEPTIANHNSTRRAGAVRRRTGVRLALSA